MALRLAADERGGDQVLVAERRPARDRRAGRCSTISRRGSSRGDVVGLVGPNGAGKSTLLRAIVGDREPDAGEIRVPDSVRIAYYRQDLAQVPQDRTAVRDHRRACGRPGAGVRSRATSGRFGFSGDSVQRRAGSLSGGETARVALAMMMLSGANFLIFDEPTNHLDVESIEALEDAIEEFDGTVLLVSHDRALLRALTTRIWVLHRQPDHRLRRRLRRVGGGQRGAGARGGGGRGGGGGARAGCASGRPPAAPSDDRRRAVSPRAEPPSARSPMPSSRVGERERRVAELRAQLEDPALYLDAGRRRPRPTGSAPSWRRPGRELEAAFAEWEAATRALEAIG